MLTPGHIATSYILAKSTALFGFTPTPNETTLIIIAGNIIDIDFLFGLIRGKRDDQHHAYITHTPVGIIAIWMIWFILLGHAQLPFINVLIGLSLVLHLILDDLGYLFYRLKLQALSPYPQINWFYPFTKSQVPQPPIYNQQTLKNYFSKTKMSALTELLLIAAALLIYFSG